MKHALCTIILKYTLSPQQVIVWDVDHGASGEWITTPRHVLVAHTAPVRCVAKATAGQDCHVVVSSSENGEMFVWDTVDGRVIESKRYPQFVHTSIQAYRTPDSQHVKLFCCGFYEEIMVVEPFSLEILFRLSSRLNSDWVSVKYHYIICENT